jgi:hypothetical protein
MNGPLPTRTLEGRERMAARRRGRSAKKRLTRAFLDGVNLDLRGGAKRDKFMHFELE